MIGDISTFVKKEFSNIPIEGSWEYQEGLGMIFVYLNPSNRKRLGWTNRRAIRSGLKIYDEILKEKGSYFGLTSSYCFGDHSKVDYDMIGEKKCIFGVRLSR